VNYSGEWQQVNCMNAACSNKKSRVLVKQRCVMWYGRVKSGSINLGLLRLFCPFVFCADGLFLFRGEVVLYVKSLADLLGRLSFYH